LRKQTVSIAAGVVVIILGLMALADHKLNGHESVVDSR